MKTMVHMFGELQEGGKVWEDQVIMLSLPLALHKVGKPPRLTIQLCSCRSLVMERGSGKGGAPCPY